MKEEELEFISVVQDDDNELNNTYHDPSASDASNNVIGNWVFNQSKV